MTAPNLLPARLVSIDALRGVAAIGVVLYHTNATPGVDRSLLFGDAVDDAMFLGKYGVWLFFVISGFCIHLQWARAQVQPGAQPLTFGEFWRRRIRRLYPPYLATLAFYIALRISTGALQMDGLSAWQVFLHLFMLQTLDPRALSTMNNVYWTLAVEEQSTCCISCSSRSAAAGDGRPRWPLASPRASAGSRSPWSSSRMGHRHRRVAGRHGAVDDLDSRRA